LERKPRPKEPEPAKPEQTSENVQQEKSKKEGIEDVQQTEDEPEKADSTVSDLDDIPDIPTAEPSQEQQQEEADIKENGANEEPESHVEEAQAPSAETAASSDQPQHEPPTIVEPAQAEAEESQSTEPHEKVFTGWSNRPYGKIGIPLHADPAQIPENMGRPVGDSSSSSSPKAATSPSHVNANASMTDFSDKWGTREGGSLPSPRAVSPAMMSPTASNDSQTGESKKVPIWLRKGGV
jgi:hypothetical protein